LPIPRLAEQLDRSWRTSLELVEQPLEGLELVGTPDEGRLLARRARRDPVRHRASLDR
jgi:hypothetical protein